MAAIRGDGSPWSYLCASILARELLEFGAWWHGLDWSTHVLVGREPVLAAAPEPDQWQWVGERPETWAPSVEAEGDQIIVRLHTYSEACRRAFYQHRDAYRAASYCARRERLILAEGPPGYCL